MEMPEQQLAGLSPEQRRLVELLLSQQQTETRHEQNRGTDLVPLTGPQQWFFEAVDDYGGWWNVLFPLDVPSFLGRSSGLIRQVFEHLLAHHAELRAHFVRQAAGWQKVIAEPDTPASFTCVDLAHLERSEQDQAIQAAADALNYEIEVSTFPLFRAALFYLGESRPARLVLFVHHLIMDGVSIGILAGDFQMAYQQLARGEPIRFPPKTTSVKAYVERLQAYARSAELRRELEDYWLQLPWTDLAPLPLDDPEGVARRTIGSMDSVDAALDADATHVLQIQLPRVYKAQIAEVLLMALMQAVSAWTGSRYQLISWLYDGRTSAIPVLADLDLSRTVGWLGFSSYLLLERVAASDPVESLRAIQAQFRRIPHKGLGLNILRHYGEAEAVETVKSLDRADTIVEINYLGNMGDPSGGQSDILLPATEPRPVPWDPLSQDFHHLLYLTTQIAGGCFRARWEYNTRVYQRITIEKIASDFMAALRALINHARSQAPI
ncbi:MAG TPA: condensation domain-containing protein [Anaerolineae bacterium]|nr:condensation domain-containing protein [Anaerolineae bacterium]